MKRMEPLNRQELLNLLASARQDSTRDWCMLLLMYCHGLRASEVGQLKRSDLNERDWTLSIERLKGSDKTLQVIYPNSETEFISCACSGCCGCNFLIATRSMRFQASFDSPGIGSWVLAM